MVVEVAGKQKRTAEASGEAVDRSEETLEFLIGGDVADRPGVAVHVEVWDNTFVADDTVSCSGSGSGSGSGSDQGHPNTPSWCRVGALIDCSFWDPPRARNLVYFMDNATLLLHRLRECFCADICGFASTAATCTSRRHARTCWCDNSCRMYGQGSPVRGTLV